MFQSSRRYVDYTEETSIFVYGYLHDGERLVAPPEHTTRLEILTSAARHRLNGKLLD